MCLYHIRRGQRTLTGICSLLLAWVLGSEFRLPSVGGRCLTHLEISLALPFLPFCIETASHVAHTGWELVM